MTYWLKKRRHLAKRALKFESILLAPNYKTLHSLKCSLKYNLYLKIHCLTGYLIRVFEPFWKTELWIKGLVGFLAPGKVCWASNLASHRACGTLYDLQSILSLVWCSLSMSCECRPLTNAHGLCIALDAAILIWFSINVFHTMSDEHRMDNSVCYSPLVFCHSEVQGNEKQIVWVLLSNISQWEYYLKLNMNGLKKKKLLRKNDFKNNAEEPEQ